MRTFGSMLAIALSVANLFAADFYGIAFDPVQTNAATTSRIVPANAWGVQMIQPDGKRRFLAHDTEREGVIKGAAPWIGYNHGGKAEVWADPEMTEGRRRTAFSFEKGELKRLFLDGATYEFPLGTRFSDSLESLFPEVRKREWHKGGRGDLWQGSGRLRLWFTNPNSAGFLMATLCLVAFAVLVSARWYWKIPAVLILCGSFYLLALTGARAAMLSLALGVAVCLGFVIRKILNWKSLVAMVVVGIALVFAVQKSGMTDRFTTNMFHMDDMIQLRFDVGKAALRMFADGPCGWHVGSVNPGKWACLNWYLPDRTKVIRTHLLTLGELGWFLGFGYVLFWCLGLALGLHGAIRRMQPLTLSVWLAFASAAMFNPVHTAWELWVVPAILAGMTGWQMVRRREWRPMAVCLAGSALLAVGIVGGLIAAGRMLDDGKGPAIRSEGGVILVNGKEPVSWVVGDFAVLGGWGFPGREIEYFYLRNPDAPAIAYLEDLHELPRRVGSLVLAGRSGETYLEEFKAGNGELCKADRLLFLSPSFEPDAIPPELLKRSTVGYLCGSFAAARWRNRAEALPDWVMRLPGVELYVPNWMNIVTGYAPKRKENKK